MEAVNTNVEVSAPVSTETVETPTQLDDVEVNTKSLDTKATPEQKVEAKPKTPQKYKLTFGGKTAEVTDAELDKMYQTAQEADTAKERIKLMEEQVSQFVNRGKQDIGYLAEQLGIDEGLLDAYAEQRILSKLEEANLTEEQKELRDYKKRIAAIEAKEAKAREVEEQKMAETVRTRASKLVESTIAEELKEIKNPTAYHAAGIAEQLLVLMDAEDVETITPELVKKAHKMFKDGLRANVKGAVSELTEEEVIDFIGPDLFNKLLKYDLQKSKKNIPQFAPKGIDVTEGTKTRKSGMSIDDFIEAKLKAIGD